MTAPTPVQLSLQPGELDASPGLRLVHTSYSAAPTPTAPLTPAATPLVR